MGKRGREDEKDKKSNKRRRAEESSTSEDEEEREEREINELKHDLTEYLNSGLDVVLWESESNTNNAVVFVAGQPSGVPLMRTKDDKHSQMFHLFSLHQHEHSKNQTTTYVEFVKTKKDVEHPQADMVLPWTATEQVEPWIVERRDALHRMMTTKKFPLSQMHYLRAEAKEGAVHFFFRCDEKTLIPVGISARHLPYSCFVERKDGNTLVLSIPKN
jgi:hypothetical protein